MEQSVEKNVYTLNNFSTDSGTPSPVSQDITFYKKNPDGTWENGTTVEELLRVAKERLILLCSKFPSRENALAITKIEEASMWLEARTKDRIKRGVEGQHKL